MAVDHEERRRRIAEVTAQVTAREGLEAATIRRIAAELGGPTKIITYYFADKQALLLFTYDFLGKQYQHDMGSRDPTDLIETLMAMGVSDERSVIRWRCNVGFWDLAARNPAFAALRRRHMDGALEHIRELLVARVGEREDLDDLSLLINAIVQGMSVQSLTEPERWTPERMRRVLTERVDMLLGPPKD
jgi:AcrR family transcriptional regulator